MKHMQLTIRLPRETAGRWIGDIPVLPGVTVYGATPEEGTRKVKSLALRVIAEEIEHGEMTTAADILQFSVATVLRAGGGIYCGDVQIGNQLACTFDGGTRFNLSQLTTPGLEVILLKNLVGIDSVGGHAFIG